MSYSDLGGIKVAIIGASGYTGVELLRLLHVHPNVEVKYLIAQSNAGAKASDIYPHLHATNLPDMISLSEMSGNWEHVDIVFSCLPHATSQAIIKELPEHLKIIDLSADYRLYDPNTYEKWYGNPHCATELQKEAVYGLTELYREPIRGARLVACPGCYPTCASIPLVPLLRHKLIKHSDIIIDAKSGASGAGRSVKQGTLFCEVNETMKAYGVCKHRHIPEIEQTLSAAAGDQIVVHFTPQLVPMNRGILSTIYVKLADDVTTRDLHECLLNRYRDDQFIHLFDYENLPSTKDVMGTNQCFIGISEARTPDTAIIVSVIDNLTKGSSGQAIQNMNIMCGLEEVTGLQSLALYP